MRSPLSLGGAPKIEADWLHSRLRHIIGDHPPFAVKPALEHLCLSVDAFRFRSDISGLLIRDGERYYVAVNRRHPITRRRFSAAHELYHYLRHRWYLDDGSIWVCGDDMPGLDAELEREADAFAAHYLMPRYWVEFCCALPIDYLARSFGVSLQAAQRRLEELGLLRSRRRAAGL